MLKIHRHIKLTCWFYSLLLHLLIYDWSIPLFSLQILTRYVRVLFLNRLERIYRDNNNYNQAFLYNRKGGRLFQPAPSEQFEGHFHSFMDADFIHRSISPQVQNIDAEQPSRKEKNLGICKNSSCRQFSFLSEADSKRHYRLEHGGKRGNDIGDTGVKRQFKCGVCNIYHLTQYRLRKHIEETGHKGVMGRPKNNK